MRALLLVPVVLGLLAACRGARLVTPDVPAAERAPLLEAAPAPAPAAVVAAPPAPATAPVAAPPPTMRIEYYEISKG